MTVHCDEVHVINSIVQHDEFEIHDNQVNCSNQCVIVSIQFETLYSFDSSLFGVRSSTQRPLNTCCYVAGIYGVQIDLVTLSNPGPILPIRTR